MKKFLLLVIALFSVFMFTACGQNEVDKEFVLITGDELKEKKVTITFRVPSGVIATALEGTLLPAFAEEWPNITVELEKITDGYDGVLTQNIYDLNDGKAPTLSIGYPDHMALYYSGDGLISLDPYFEADSIDLTDFVASYLPENQIGNADGDNNYYGLPLNKSTEVLIYNKTVFEKLKYEVPTTWDEVETLGKKMIQDCKDGKLDNIVQLSEGEKAPSTYISENETLFFPIAYDSTDNAFITLTRQFGAEYTEKVNVNKGYAVFNNTQTKDALKYFQDLAKEGVFAVAETFNESYASNAFKAMKCLMTIGSSAGVKYNLPSGNKFELGVAPIPYKTEDKKYVIQQGTNIFMFSQSTNIQRAAAWQLIKFLTATENTVEFAMESGGYLPVRNSGYETDEYKAYLAANTQATSPTNYFFAQAANVGLSYKNDYKMFVDPGFVGSSTIRNEVGSLFSKIIVKKSEIEQSILDTLSTLGPKFKKAN